MELLIYVLNFVLHIDKHLAELAVNYGTKMYVILFLIIFCETGLVVTPFLPGDSLLFMIGTLGAAGDLNFKCALVILIIAASGGNTLNYFIGKMIGNRILQNGSKSNIHRFINKKNLKTTEDFYYKHGGKTIVLSRFLPILRTFAPFVAGVGKMSFAKFTMVNSVGSILWVIIFSASGYFFGNMPFVKSNFTYVIGAIIAISLLPTLITGLIKKRKR